MKTKIRGKASMVPNNHLISDPNEIRLQPKLKMISPQISSTCYLQNEAYFSKEDSISKLIPLRTQTIEEPSSVYHFSASTLINSFSDCTVSFSDLVYVFYFENSTPSLTCRQGSMEALPLKMQTPRGQAKISFIRRRIDKKIINQRESDILQSPIEKNIKKFSQETQKTQPLSNDSDEKSKDVHPSQPARRISSATPDHILFPNSLRNQSEGKLLLNMEPNYLYHALQVQRQAQKSEDTVPQKPARRISKERNENDISLFNSMIDP